MISVARPESRLPVRVVGRDLGLPAVGRGGDDRRARLLDGEVEDVGVQHRQQRPLDDAIVGLDQDPINPARNVGADVDGVSGLHRPRGRHRQHQSRPLDGAGGVVVAGGPGPASTGPSPGGKAHKATAQVRPCPGCRAHMEEFGTLTAPLCAPGDRRAPDRISDRYPHHPTCPRHQPANSSVEAASVELAAIGAAALAASA